MPSLTPLSPDERAVIRDVVDQAPPLSPTALAQLAALLRGAAR